MTRLAHSPAERTRPEDRRLKFYELRDMLGRLRHGARTGPWARRFLLGAAESFRIFEIQTELAPEMVDAGFNGVFVVEPALVRFASLKR